MAGLHDRRMAHAGGYICRRAGFRRLHKPPMVLSKRCRLREDDREKLMEAAKVPGVSVRTMHKLWNIFHDQKKRKISWSTCQRTLQREKAPLRQCFDTLTLPGRPGRRDAVLLVANLPNLLRHMLDLAPQLADLWGENALLQPVLYHDEAPAGNILSLQKLKKCSFFYLTFDIFLPLIGDTAARRSAAKRGAEPNRRHWLRGRCGGQALAKFPREQSHRLEADHPPCGPLEGPAGRWNF